MLDATKLRKWLNSIIIFVGFEIGLFSCLGVTRLDRPSSGKSFVRFEVQKHGICGEWAGHLQKIARGPERPFFPNSIPVRKFAIERKTRVTLVLNGTSSEVEPDVDTEISTPSAIGSM